VSQLGLGIGKKYHCSRPPGLLTAHGYIRRQVDELRQQTALETGDASGTVKNNRAVQEFVRRHCRSQREKGRKIIALRLIASLDPDKVEAMVRYPVDLDRVLVSAIEGTLSKVAAKYYPGTSWDTSSGSITTPWTDWAGPISTGMSCSCRRPEMGCGSA